MACNRDYRTVCMEPYLVIFNSINVARLLLVSRCVVNGRRDGFEYAHAKCCARGTREGSLSSGHRSVCPARLRSRGNK